MRFTAIAVLAALCAAGCGGSKHSIERTKVQNLKDSALFTASKILATPEQTLIKAGSRETGAAFVTRDWQLPNGTSPRDAFNRALKQLAASGVTFAPPQCGAQLYSVQGSARISSTETNQSFWPGSVALLVASKAGMRVGTVKSPYLQLTITVPYGKPPAVLPEPTPTAAAALPC